jgi:hypothetical protein
VAERRAHQIVQADLLLQLPDTVDDRLGRAVQHHVPDVVVHRIQPIVAALDVHGLGFFVLRSGIGIDQPCRAPACDLGRLLARLGKGDQARHRDVAPAVVEAGGGKALGIEAALAT